MFKLIKLVPIKTNFNIMKYSKLFVSTAAALVITSFVLLFTKSFNYGIDFSGGILIEIKTKTQTETEELRTLLKKFSPEIQSEGNTKTLFSIRLPKNNKTETEITSMLNEVKSTLKPDTEYRNTQVVGAKVSGELIINSIWAILLAILVISLYIWIRFELHFALGAGISLAHDIILALGMLIVTRLEFNLTTLASLLTLAGYSINDTVVIYDRIRENLKRYKSKSINEIVNISINDTLSRTMLTSITTFLATLTIFLFGGEVLKGFSAVMLFGIIVGTYSSTLISTSIIALFGKDKIK